MNNGLASPFFEEPNGSFDSSPMTGLLLEM